MIANINKYNFNDLSGCGTLNLFAVGYLVIYEF